MREILFRGQTRRKGEYYKNLAYEPCDSNWVYGGIFAPNNGSDRWVIYGCESPNFNSVEKFVVWSDTVGQFTGLLDLDGKKIFEGDIVEFSGSLREVTFDDGKWTAREYFQGGFGISWLNQIVNQCRIIGNIFDTPELLKDKEVQQ